MKKRIAVVGSGISGLTAAYYLRRNYDVALFEAEDRIGGHSHTHELEIYENRLNVDSGFIVFNDRTYPNFIKLLDSLDVQATPTEMSFSVSGRDFEYNGHNLNTLFADRTNIVRPAFLRMIKDILRFNREARKISGTDLLLDTGSYLKKHQYGEEFCNRYLLPMAAAIWSTGTNLITEFPISALVSFFDHHGLLDLRNRPQWRVVKGGSVAYVRKIVAELPDVRSSTPVIRLERKEHSVQVVTPDTTESFDYVVIAVHSPEALEMLEDPSPEEQGVLSLMKFTSNEAKLHTDDRIMPRRPLAWASWNYHLNRDSGQAALTYFMNRLQHLPPETPLFVTLNDPGVISDDKVLSVMHYEHPFYDKDMLIAQKAWGQISGKHRTYYAGAYWRNGFHEDGVVSALRVCEQLGVEVC
ncbi:MAG: FAD-dependent oxidoreductase [Gammaproteobacteria bacterium]|nr:FAD-dependent oxidoreductase [Gammaproteobacteria bacterium]